MDRLTVAMAQTVCVPGDIEANIGKIEVTCGEAAKSGVKVVVFSEVALTGSLQRLPDGHKPQEYATEVPGRETERLHGVCRRFDLAMVVGTVEAGRERKLYKTAFVVTPDGYGGKFRKYQPWAGERETITPGSEFPLFRISGWTFGIGICCDLYYPELPQLYAVKGADVYLVPTGDSAFPVGNDDKAYAASVANLSNLAGFKRTGLARASDNGLYVLVPVDVNSGGGSIAFDPTGEQIAYGRAGEELIPVELRRDLLDRTRPGLIPSLRPEIFRQMADACEQVRSEPPLHGLDSKPT